MPWSSTPSRSHRRSSCSLRPGCWDSGPKIRIPNTSRLGVAVKLVMALRTRGQAELVDAEISFHLNAGVDFVIATDHRSEDGTLEILEAYEREGCLRLIRETGEQVRGSDWRTRMAQLAALEHGADWV